MKGTRSLGRVLRAEWERSLAWTLATGGVVLLFLGYRNVAASPFAAEEIAHVVTGGVGALVLLVASVGLLLAADLRDEADKLDRIAARLRRTAGSLRPAKSTRMVCTAVAVVGLVFLVAGWARAAGTADFDRSLGGLAAAVLGFGLITAGIAGHSLTVRRTVRLRIGELVAAGYRNGVSPATVVDAADGREWTADGLARFHLRSCPALLSASGPARPVDGPAARLEPCRLCHVEG